MNLVQRPLPPELVELGPLALDLRWTWTHAADALWRAVDGDAWQRTRNPWFILQSVPEARLRALAGDAAFLRELDEVARERRRYAARPPSTATALDGASVGYFSMEFAIGEAIPMYAGGLGVLAGDYLKTASDLGMPLVGVGLLFQEGYFRQQLDNDGRQHELYPYNDPSTLPIEPLISPSGGWLRLTVELPGRPLWLRVWRATVGRVSLLLLDSNDPFNAPADRAITSKLYPADPELRLLQEIVLGIGGWRALEAVGAPPEIAHLNEGHAAFAIVERARSLQQASRLRFREALWATRAGNLFTTHTPVAAGFDRFDPQLIEKYFPSGGEYLAPLGIGADELLALGRRDGAEAGEPFNMAFLAMRGSSRSNGVSALHAEVSRQIFAPLCPRWPLAEVPVTHVTNGVHVPSWDSSVSEALWTNGAGEPWSQADEQLTPRSFDDAELWRMRNQGRRALVDGARARLRAQLLRRGAAADEVTRASSVLDPNVLTLGFARRFAEYKRPTLLLHDSDRLLHLLHDAERPLQLVLAGKAHPADRAGAKMIEEWLAFVRRPDVRARAVFLEDYDLDVAGALVQGVDVWLNTPRRPMEACGTSGMKVLVNGGLNLSTLDGWWAEAWTDEVGWSLGDGDEHGDADARDADELHRLLAERIVPEFYDRGAGGVPRRWLARVRASMTRLTPRYSCNRMARDYAELYRPSVSALRSRSVDGYAPARALARWEQQLRAHWPTLAIGRCELQVEDGRLLVDAVVHLGAIDATSVRVEAYADGDRPIALTLIADASDSEWTRYRGAMPTSRSASDFTVRVVPRHDDAFVPIELPLIRWQR